MRSDHLGKHRKTHRKAGSSRKAAVLRQSGIAVGGLGVADNDSVNNTNKIKKNNDEDIRRRGRRMMELDDFVELENGISAATTLDAGQYFFRDLLLGRQDGGFVLKTLE